MLTPSINLFLICLPNIILNVLSKGIHVTVKKDQISSDTETNIEMDSKIIEGYANLDYLALDQYDYLWNPFQNIASCELNFERQRTEKEEVMEIDDNCLRYRSQTELLNRIYQGVDGFGLSEAETKRITDLGGAPTYGEIAYASMEAITQVVMFSSDDVFYDLGSGVGKFPIFVHLWTTAKKSIGIELSESRHNGALNAMSSLYDYENDGFNALADENRELLFIHGDISETDLSDATIIFMNSLCFSNIILKAMVDTFTKLAPGLCIITLKELPQHPRLKYSRKDSFPTSWSGNVPFHFYELLP